VNPRNFGQERLTLSISEAARLIGLSRNATYDAARRGDLPVVIIGRRILVQRAQLERMFGLESIHSPVEP
jgi:excisionase family DNA binding protein